MKNKKFIAEVLVFLVLLNIFLVSGDNPVKEIDTKNAEINSVIFSVDGESSFIKNGTKEIIASTESVKVIVGIEYGEQIKNVTIIKEGEKIIIGIGGATGEDCRIYFEECELGNNVLCEKYKTNCGEKQIVAETKEAIKIKNNKIYMKDREIKIMPDTASEKAIANLELKKNVTIEIKDTGKPVYEVSGEKDAKVFGFIKSKANVKTIIDAETGKILGVQKPWWSFLASGI